MSWKLFLGVVVSFFLLIPVVHAQDFFTVTLRYGGKGDTVNELQEFLTDQKLYTGPISGNFFSLTRTAVRKFQIREKIRVTGAWDAKTRERANAILASDMEEDAEGEESLQSTTSTITKPVITEPVWPWVQPSAPKITSTPVVTPPAVTQPVNQPSRIPALLKPFVQPIVDFFTPTPSTTSTVPSTPMVTPAPLVDLGKCGDGVCGTGESTRLCPSDCFITGSCNFNGICENNGFETKEYASFCPSDCAESKTASTTQSSPAPAPVPNNTLPPMITIESGAPSGYMPTFIWTTNRQTAGELKVNGITYTTPLSTSHRVTTGFIPTGGYNYTLTASDGTSSSTINGWLLITCGDKFCSMPENATDCPTDCKSGCGDGICATGEGGNCSTDCRSCPSGNSGYYCSPNQVCGDAATRTCCNKGESFCNGGCSATACTASSTVSVTFWRRFASALYQIITFPARSMGF